MPPGTARPARPSARSSTPGSHPVTRSGQRSTTVSPTRRCPSAGCPRCATAPAGSPACWSSRSSRSRSHTACRGLSELAESLAGTLTLDEVARVALRYGLSSPTCSRCRSGSTTATPGGWSAGSAARCSTTPTSGCRRSGAGSRPTRPPRWPWRPAPGSPGSPPTAHPLRESAQDRHDQKVRALGALPLRTPSLRGALTVGTGTTSTLVARRARAADRGGGAGRAGGRAGPPVRGPARHRPAAAAQHAARRTCPSDPGSGSRRATTRASTATRPAATSTTRSRCPTAGSRWCSATWPGTTCGRPR